MSDLIDHRRLIRVFLNSIEWIALMVAWYGLVWSVIIIRLSTQLVSVSVLCSFSLRTYTGHESKVKAKSSNLRIIRM